MSTATTAAATQAEYTTLTEPLKQNYEPISYPVHELDLRSQESSFSVPECLQQHKGCTLLILGGPGAGKTSFAHLLVDTWINGTGLTGYELVCFARLSDKRVREASTIEKFAELIGVHKNTESFSQQIKSFGESVLFILDGFDEVDIKHNSVVFQIASRKLFPKSTMVVLSRPVGVALLPTTLRLDFSYDIVGFSQSGLKDFLAESLQGNQERLEEYLEQQDLMSMCQIPLICSLVVKYFIQSSHVLPDAVTPLIHTIVFELIKAELVTRQHTMASSIQQIEDLPKDLLYRFTILAKLALESTVSKKRYENANEHHRYISAFCLQNSLSSLEDLEIFGLVQRVPNRDSPNLLQHCFIHPAIQDYLASYELHRNPPFDQLEFLSTNAVEIFHNHPTLLLCYFGLTFKNSETYNPTKSMIASVVDEIVLCLNLDHDDDEESTKLAARLLFFRCISESQESAFYKKICSRYSNLTRLCIEPHELTSTMRVAVGKMVANSGLKNWKVTTSRVTKKSAEDLTFVIQSFSLDCKVKPEKNDASFLTLSPVLSSSHKTPPLTPTRTATAEYLERLGQIYCKALREILQKILQLYSRIKVKGDSSNLSYLSFLTCTCTCAFTDRLLILAPDLPTHYITTNAEDEESLRGSEDLAHIVQEHGGKAVEFVVLLRPILRKVRFQIPHTGKEYSLTISSEHCTLEMFNPTITSGESATREMEQLPYAVEVTTPNASSVRVFPPFPLAPRKHKDTSNEASAQNTTAGSTASQQTAPMIIEEKRTTASSYGTTQTLTTTTHIGALMVAGTSSQPHPFTHERASIDQPDHGSPMKPAIPPPGTLLYTAIDEMPPDRVYRLPDESLRLRKGGNGTIFAGNVKGLSLAIKKTNYRQREYKILIKLDHRNIVPLYAFMIGLPHHTHARRYLCYHFMPKLTGDVARMLTDHSNLTLNALRRQHGDDPHTLGKIVANLKYLLREILQGMCYLHSNNIVHRDVKGSNVLLKFFCSCKDPLTCKCDSRCQVRLADFDAAVELDSHGRLPPVSERSPTPTFTVIPVGTTGYRAPSCSMLVVTNNLSTLQPAFSTKADIWSFGVLATRILLGVEGRGKQRAVAILLLHYHQLVNAVEGRAFGGQLRVSRAEVNELLHVSLSMNH